MNVVLVDYLSSLIQIFQKLVRCRLLIQRSSVGGARPATSVGEHTVHLLGEGVRVHQTVSAGLRQEFLFVAVVIYEVVSFPHVMSRVDADLRYCAVFEVFLFFVAHFGSVC